MLDCKFSFSLLLLCLSFISSTLQAIVEKREDFLVLLVDAKHLDYSNPRSFFKSIAKHPKNASKSGDVGHAWIYMEGIIDGEKFVVEGGHTGEFGYVQPRYFEGIMNYVDYGCLIPEKSGQSYQLEKNPIKYLWAIQRDGRFQKGSGGHRATYAAMVPLTKDQFQSILLWIKPENYNYRDYSLVENQCTTFVAEVAKLAGLELETKVTMPITSSVSIRDRTIQLWNDPIYSEIIFSTPDQLEKSLINAVRDNKAEYAMDWYLAKYPISIKDYLTHLKETICLFPMRFARYSELR